MNLNHLLLKEAITRNYYFSILLYKNNFTMS